MKHDVSNYSGASDIRNLVSKVRISPKIQSSTEIARNKQNLRLDNVCRTVVRAN